jgi:intracellular multiplication protein IcmB
MKKSSQIISSIESIVTWFLSSVSTKYLEDYCYINTANTKFNMIARDGAIASVVKIYGSKNAVGKEQMRDMEEMLSQTLQNAFISEGHKIQFVYTRDDDRTDSALKDIMDPYKKASKRLGLDFDDIYDGKREKLKEHCAYESCYMVLWTLPSTSIDAVKEETKDISEIQNQAGFAVNGQDVFNNYTSIANNHNAFLDNTMEGFKVNGINVEIMDVKKAISDIKRLINNDIVSEDWEPILAGDNLSLREEIDGTLREGDMSSVTWPKIGSQLFPDSAEKSESGFYKIGEKYFAPLTFALPPQKILEFNQLISSIDKKVPWQISINLQSVRQGKLNLKGLSASMLAWTNSDNKLIKAGIDEIQERIGNKDPVVELSIDAITWASSEKELKKRKSIILKALQSWGTATVEAAQGDPMEAILSTMPAITKEPFGNIAYAPIEDIIKMLPIARQSHVWESGSMVFRTADHKIFPFQPGSSKQVAWNNLFFATPGNGKSVLLNAMNAANVNTLGVDELPLMGILDIGESSAGLINMIKDSLPEKQKHLVVAEKLKNTIDYAVNLLDTHLGARTLTTEDLFFITNTITMAITPIGKSAPYPSTDTLIQNLLSKAFDYFSDSKNPKEYRKHVDIKIDEVLDLHSIKVDYDTTWWEITDKLMEAGEILFANRAQKYAVPVLSDLVTIAQTNESIQDEYSEIKIETQESLIAYFNRSIGELVNQYPMLAIPTVFELSSARIISLDLNDVAPRGDGAAKKQTSLMYMIGRYIVTRSFFIDDQLIKITPKIYHKYHQEKIDKSRETPKIICYDEFHRTTGIDIVRSQVMQDMREGRKWRMQVTLVSQLLKDFDDDMIDIADGIFILSGGDNVDDIANKFKLNITMQNLLKTKVTGPNSKGAPMIYKFKAKSGTYCQLLYLTLSPIEMWAFNTTSEDVALRERLSKIIGPKKARLLLAKELSGGSAKAYMEEMVKTGDIKGSVIDALAEKILKKNGIMV